jgi:hypothetical protein
MTDKGRLAGPSLGHGRPPASSPALLVQEIGNELAGIGWARQRRFEQQVTAPFTARIAPSTSRKRTGKSSSSPPIAIACPASTYVEENGWTVVVRAIRGLVMLAGPVVLVGLLTTRLYRSWSAT